MAGRVVSRFIAADTECSCPVLQVQALALGRAPPRPRGQGQPRSRAQAGRPHPGDIGVHIAADAFPAAAAHSAQVILLPAAFSCFLHTAADKKL